MVLDSTSRPRRWKRKGSEASDYDPARVGWRYESVTSSSANRSTAGARRVVDTNVRGLSNEGHAYGDDWSEGDRASLLEVLRGL